MISTGTAGAASPDPVRSRCTGGGHRLHRTTTTASRTSCSTRGSGSPSSAAVSSQEVAACRRLCHRRRRRRPGSGCQRSGWWSSSPWTCESRLLPAFWKTWPVKVVTHSGSLPPSPAAAPLPSAICCCCCCSSPSTKPSLSKARKGAQAPPLLISRLRTESLACFSLLVI